MLGEAVDPKQLAVMAASACCWEILRRGAAWLMKLNGRIPERARQELAVSVASTIHAIVACLLSLKVITTKERPPSLYERFDHSQLTFAISSGYFIWDLFIVVFVEKFDPAFLIHALSCLLCYVFGQFPFLNYWGVYFLLFELSTPLLHARKALFLLENDKSPWFGVVENGFALSFFIARIAVGLPMSVMVWRDLLDLLKRPHEVHSHFVVYYYLLANTALCGLNVMWFSKMVQKALRGGKSKKA
jgi:hypothetical protein